MKHLFTFLLLSCSAQLFAQGTITSITVHPANPTVNDEVEIRANVQFTSGDCEQVDQGNGTNGFTISAYAHHCLGLLTFICPDTDTFQIGLLPAGDYTFDFTITSGFGGPSCTAGIVPDDNSQLQFTVSGSVGIEEILLDSDFAYPNPVSEVLYFKSAIKELAIINDVNGRELILIPQGSSQIDLGKLASGFYVLRTENKRFPFIKN